MEFAILDVSKATLHRVVLELRVYREVIFEPDFNFETSLQKSIQAQQNNTSLPCQELASL